MAQARMAQRPGWLRGQDGLEDSEGGVCPVALVEDHDDEDGAADHADTTAALANNQTIRLANNNQINQIIFLNI